MTPTLKSVMDPMGHSLIQTAQKYLHALPDAEVFDQMMASIDVADDSPELKELAALPRRITQ